MLKWNTLELKDKNNAEELLDIQYLEPSEMKEKI